MMPVMLCGNKLDYSAQKVERWLDKDKETILYMVEKESDNQLDMQYHVNVPGVYLPNDKKTIKRFSLDYTPIGVNEQNIRWSYEVAKALQMENGKRKTKELKHLRVKYNLNKKFIDSISTAQIPAGVNLLKIDDSKRSWVVLEYKRMLKAGIRPLQIKKALERQLNGKKDHTYNEIESFMVYRVLIEEDRYFRGWKCFEDLY